MKTRMLPPVLCAGLAVLLLAAADWPQWRGPERNDVSKETGLLKTWPKAGPKLKWTCEETGIGYSGPAVVGDRLYVLGSDEKNEFLLALDVGSGKKVWSSGVGAFFKNGYGSGPRSTPTVEGGQVVALGADGTLGCFDAATGAKQWTVKLTDAAIGGSRPFWGYSESPLVDGDHVICSPGGGKGTLAALDKKTGEVLWRSKELTDNAGYSSIVVAELSGVRQYVQQTMKGIAGISPEDGKLLWYFANPDYRTAVVPTPLLYNGEVYAVAGYGAGASLLKFERADGKFKVEQLYSQAARKLMDNKHGGVVAVGDYVYGWSDAKGGKWVCQELRTGKEVWSSTKLGRGSVTCADGNLYCYSEKDGTCVLAAASPDGWNETGRFTIPRHTQRRERADNVWTHPIVANGRLYLRDQELLFCFDVKRP